MENKYYGIKSLADTYAKMNGTTLKVAEDRVREMKDLLEHALLDEKCKGIQFIDTLTLKKVVRKGKIGRNPKTKEEVYIPERMGIKAEIGKNLATKFEGIRG